MKSNTIPINHHIALLAMRLMLATIFVFHGSQKLFGWFGGYGIEGTAGYFESIGIPFPVLSTILAGLTEFGGGLILLAGTGTRLAVVPMAITMLVASFTAHSGFSIQNGGMEYSLSLAVFLAALGLMGPGSFTVGRLVSAATGKRPAAQSDRVVA